jgi:hypothetical protein
MAEALRAMTSGDRKGEEFLRALDEAAHGPAGAEAITSPRTPEPLACANFTRDSWGSAARWELAMQWAEAVIYPPAQPESAPSEAAGLCGPDVDAIAAELGLEPSLTPRELASRWRAFVWRNHPDRQPAGLRKWAGARVAIANALYDAAIRGPARRG